MINRCWVLKKPNFGIFRGQYFENTLGEVMYPQIYLFNIPVYFRFILEFESLGAE